MQSMGKTVSGAGMFSAGPTKLDPLGEADIPFTADALTVSIDPGMPPHESWIRLAGISMQC